MSRFDSGRRLRIAVWTGAALAWGTTMAFAAQRSTESAHAATGEAQPDVAPSFTEVSSPSTMPTMPTGGLVVLRFQPSTVQAPEVRTVYVQQAAPAPARAQATAPAPAPKSSGS